MLIVILIECPKVGGVSSTDRSRHSYCSSPSRCGVKGQNTKANNKRVRLPPQRPPPPPRRLKHSVGQNSMTWPELAAATSLATSEDSAASNPLSPKPIDVFREPAETGPCGPSSNLRTAFPSDTPLDSSPTSRGGQGQGRRRRVDDVGFPPGGQSDGYTSVTTLL